jgi:hypothetical protein
MQNSQNNKWVDIVAKLTLVRSILGIAAAEVDDIINDINAGHSNLSEQTATMLENVIKDLVSIGEDVGNVAVEVPIVLLDLSQQRSQPSNQTQSLGNCSDVFSNDALFNSGEFADSNRKAS